jgi:hypothetical protein
MGTLKHQWAAALLSLFFLGSIGRNKQKNASWHLEV